MARSWSPSSRCTPSTPGPSKTSLKLSSRLAGSRLFQEVREVGPKLKQRVAPRRVLLQVLGGEGVEEFLAEGVLENRKFLAQTLQEPGVIGVAIDCQALQRRQRPRARHDSFGLVRPDVNEAPRLCRGHAFHNAAGLHDGCLHPALDLSEIAPVIVGFRHGFSNTQLYLRGPAP